jgi:hypothetical protein
MEKDVTTVTGLSSNANWNYSNNAWALAHPSVLLVNKAGPQAKIMFFGACSLSPGFGFPGEVPPFVQMWDVHDLSIDGEAETRVRAMIVPVYPPNHWLRKNFNTDDVELGLASKEWIYILSQLVAGANVTDAVNYANNQILSDPVYLQNPQYNGVYWTVLGNHGVNLRSEE